MIGFGSETPEEEKEIPLAAAAAAEAAAAEAEEDAVSELETLVSADMRWNEGRQTRGDALQRALCGTWHADSPHHLHPHQPARLPRSPSQPTT